MHPDVFSPPRSLIAVIPARGGSKRVPHKNIVPFRGRPLVAWTIEAALKSRCFSQVYVDTDSEEVARISRGEGATIPFLRETAADDISPVSEATVAFLKRLGWKSGDIVVQLFAVCPLRSDADIRSAAAYFEASNAQFLISCYRFGWANPWWAFEMDRRSRPQHLFPQALKARSQDLPPLYAPTGAIWIADIAALLSAGTFYGPDYCCWELAAERAIDIDTLEDLKFAEAIARL